MLEVDYDLMQQKWHIVSVSTLYTHTNTHKHTINTHITVAVNWTLDFLLGLGCGFGCGWGAHCVLIVLLKLILHCLPLAAAAQIQRSHRLQRLIWEVRRSGTGSQQLNTTHLRPRSQGTHVAVTVGGVSFKNINGWIKKITCHNRPPSLPVWSLSC